MRALCLLVLLVLPACDDFAVFSASATLPDAGTVPDLTTVSGSGDAGGADLATRRWEQQASGITQDLNAVWGSGPDDVWAVGAGGVVLRRQGQGPWTPVSTGAKETLLSVWGSAGDVWMAGDLGQTVRMAMQPVTSYLKEGNRLYAGSGSLLVGANSSIYRLSGQMWTWDPYVGAFDFHGVWSGPSDGWAVGARGLVVHLTGSMLPEASGTANLLHAVWSDGKGAAVAVGDKGTIIRRGNGGVWARVANADSRDLRAVHGAGTMQMWAAGAGGTVVESKDGGLTWKTQANVPDKQLNGVWASAVDDIYLVGAGGLILHYGR